MPVLPQQKIVLEMEEAACRERDAPRGYLGMSGIGDPCARKLWYRFRGYTPLPLKGRAAMIFDLGNRVEEATLYWLRAAGYRVEDCQQGYEAHNGLFRGHSDGTIHGVTSRPHILEIKSANDARWRACRDCGMRDAAPVYYCQVQCYMGYSGLDRALFLVMNKNTCELYAERVRLCRPDFEALHQRASTIISSRLAPERAFPDGSDECGWCEYRNHCRAPEIAAQTLPTCGTCYWMTPYGVEMRCEFASHPCVILHWGRSCADWLFRESLDAVPF